MAINIWLLVINSTTKGRAQDNYLVLGDNTSAIGWIFRRTQIPPESWYFELANLIARKVAGLVTDADCSLCAQHIKGVHFADSARVEQGNSPFLFLDG